MAKITIVGGGQAGLQLGIGLVQNGHDVTVVSDRTPEQIRDGRVMSSQCMFATALDHERDARNRLLGRHVPAGRGDLARGARTRRSPARKAIDWAARPRPRRAVGRPAA